MKLKHQIVLIIIGILFLLWLGWSDLMEWLC